MTKTIGILGLGSIGMRHAKNLQDLGCTIVGYDPKVSNGTKREDVFKADGIIIASPTKDHLQDITDAVPSGKPVFCEKPAAFIPAAVIEQVALVGYNLRFHPCVIAAEDWLRNGKIGNIMWADLTCGQFNMKYTDSVVFNWSHEIDLAQFFFGFMAAAEAKCIRDTTRGTEVLAKITMSPKTRPILVQVHVDYLTRPEIRQFIIVGDQGQIICDLLGRQGWVRDIEGNIVDHIDGSYSSYDDDYIDEMKEFLGIIDGNRPYERGCSGPEALHIVNICNQALQTIA